jgi:hypothetical protein
LPSPELSFRDRERDLAAADRLDRSRRNVDVRAPHGRRNVHALELARIPVAADAVDETESDAVPVDDGPARPDLQPGRMLGERQVLVVVLPDPRGFDERRRRQELAEQERVLQRVDEPPARLPAIDRADVPGSDCLRVLGSAFHLGADPAKLCARPRLLRREREHATLRSRLEHLVGCAEAVELALIQFGTSSRHAPT